MKECLGETKEGTEVYLDLESSHALTHFAHVPGLREAVLTIIPTLEPTKEGLRVERDTGKNIGTSDLVQTYAGDEVVYAKRPLRSSYSRFVKGKQPTPTNVITIALQSNTENSYDLYTAYVGKDVPSFPGGDYLPERSKEFWSQHALVWGSQEIVPGTETNTFPW